MKGILMRTIIAALLAALPAVAPAEASGPSPVEERSPVTATLLSVGVPLVGVALALTASEYRNVPVVTAATLVLGVGPTTGQFYAGNTWNRGLQIRLAGTAVGTVGIALVLASCTSLDSCDSPAGVKVGVPLVVGGAATFVVGYIYEMATAARSARAFNTRHSTQLTVVPMLGRENGVALAGRF